VEYVLENQVFPAYAAMNVPLGSGDFSVVSQYIGPGGIAPATVTDNPLAAASTTINVTSTVNYVIPGAIRIDSENVLCAGTAGGNQFTGCVRGWAGSAAAVHNAGATVTQSVVTSTGVSGDARRVVQGSVSQSGGALFYEPFPNGSVPDDTIAGNSCASSPALSWCYAYQNNDGQSLFDAASQAADGTGSLLARTTAGRNNRLRGYRERTLAAPIPGGTVLTLSLGYKKNYITAAPSQQTIEVQLVYNIGAPVTPAGWGDTATSNANTWNTLTPASFTVPVNRTVTAVRLYFDLRNPNVNGTQTFVWFDEVRLTSPGGVDVVSWREVVQ
jgi:hypothetical protein